MLYVMKLNFFVTTTFVCIRYGTLGNDFFDNFDTISTAPPESIGAPLKCGEDDQRGKFMCVPYFNCDPTNNTIVNNPVADGSAGIIPRSFPYRQCWHYLQVCCQIGATHSTLLPTEHIPTIILEYKLVCGIKNKEIDFTSNSEQFPWIVTIFSKNEKSNDVLCGGSLISPVAVLTAAHCVAGLKSNQINIRTGQWSTKTMNKKDSYQEKNVSQIIINEHYLESTLYNDVALLILNSSLSNEKNVGTICLPSNMEDFDEEKCFVSRWNKISPNTRSYNKSKSSLIPNNVCQKLLRTKLGNEFILDHSFICANEGSSVNHCQGVGGNPLMCLDSSNSNRYFQVGISSWSTGCDKNALPDTYTNVTLFRNWIDYKLGELGYSSSFYIP